MDPLEKESIYQERPVKIICIGAGASGLLLAYKLKTRFRHFSLTIFEKNPEISGTWYENKYPGCACDVPAHNYTYSFEPKHDWSTVYASSTEIRTYFTSFSEKYQLAEYIKTQHCVQHAQWQEEEGQWVIDVMELTTGHIHYERCDILISATGYLNQWAWPEIPGRELFHGKIVHSAAWDSSLEVYGKKVALLGSGSSATQILPQIQPIAEHVSIFIKSPLWLMPPLSLESRNHSPVDIQNFARNPDLLLRLRKANESYLNSVFRNSLKSIDTHELMIGALAAYLRNSKLQNLFQQACRTAMKTELQDPVLESALIPEWALGCRRVTPDTTFIKTVKKENVQVVQGGVDAFNERGCVGPHGKEYHADVIICATGFDTSFIPRFPIIGNEGRNLQEEWKERPSSYLGIGASGFPNFFMFLGPYSPVANGPTMSAIEAQVEHVLKMVDRYQTEPIHSFSPKYEAERDFTLHVAAFMKSTVYSDSCRSGHKNHTINGRVPTLWPGSTLHYLQTMQDVRYDDWHIIYSGNRFSFLGNGISHAEFDPTSDLSYYLHSIDESPPLARRKRMEKIMRSGSQPERTLLTAHRSNVVKLVGEEEDLWKTKKTGEKIGNLHSAFGSVGYFTSVLRTWEKRFVDYVLLIFGSI